VAGEIVEHQEHPQWRQRSGQRDRPEQFLLPPRPARPVLLGREHDGRQERRQDGLELGFEPPVQHHIRTRRHALHAGLARGRREEREQLGGAVADMLVGEARRHRLGAPLLARHGDGLERARLVLGPDREAQPCSPVV